MSHAITEYTDIGLVNCIQSKTEGVEQRTTALFEYARRAHARGVIEGKRHELYRMQIAAQARLEELK